MIDQVMTAVKYVAETELALEYCAKYGAVTTFDVAPDGQPRACIRIGEREVIVFGSASSVRETKWGELLVRAVTASWTNPI